MSTFPPLDVSVSPRRLSCVLDAELALSEFGLLFALRLAKEMNVWLIRTLWQILDNTEFYLSNPQLLLQPHGDSGKGGMPTARTQRRLVKTLQQWEAVRLERDLLSMQLFWAGDARYESLVPRDVDQNVVERFDRLAAELDKVWRPFDGSAADCDALRDCRRDAIALALALNLYSPVVFTVTPRPDGDATPEPNVCRYLRECGVACRKVIARRASEPTRRHLLPLFARSGVIELLWSGVDLAVVHVVAPRGLISPAAEGEGGYQETLAKRSASSSADSPLSGALGFWYAFSG